MEIGVTELGKTVGIVKPDLIWILIELNRRGYVNKSTSRNLEGDKIHLTEIYGNPKMNPVHISQQGRHH